MNPLIRFIFRTHAQSTQREKKFHTKTRCAEALSNSVVIRNWQRSLLLYYLTSGMKYDQSEIGDQYKLIFERIDDLWNYTRNMQKKKRGEINLYLCMDFLSLPVPIKMQIKNWIYRMHVVRTRFINFKTKLLRMMIVLRRFAYVPI